MTTYMPLLILRESLRCHSEKACEEESFLREDTASCPARVLRKQLFHRKRPPQHSLLVGELN